METLTIIGCGTVGKSLGRLWIRKGLLEIHSILNRSQESAQRATEFLGQGRPVGSVHKITPTDFIMVSVADDAIAGWCEALAGACVVRPDTIVFHCSGSLPSTVLQALKAQGARIASFHPLKSFAEPLRSSETFEGTPCGIEGDEEACEKLGQLAVSCGGKVFKLNPDTKLLYHAATVLVCNDLTALLETGLRCYEKAGIPRSLAVELVRPLVEETLKNNFTLGPAGALTGPVARGDVELIRKQSAAVAHWDPLTSSVYNALGLAAVALARTKGHASNEALDAIAKCLNAPNSKQYQD